MQKHVDRTKALEELMNSELSDYSYFNWKFEEAEHEDDVSHIEVSVKNGKNEEQTMRFQVYDCENGEDFKIKVELGEDSYEKIETFDWTIKYFWMALLSW